MDGRWSLALSAGVLGGMIGCQSPQARQSADLAKQTADTTKLVKAQQATAAAQDNLPARDKRLKSETLVKLGALKEQAAENAERPQAERDAFRYQARQTYQKAIDQDPKCTIGYLALISSYIQSGESDKANAVFAKALKANPKNAQLWFEMGTVQARAKDWTPALENLSRAVQLDPENKQYQKTYGLALARSGRFEESYALLSKCMSESEARFNIARMLKHVGQPDECQQQLELAVKANPNFLPARELLDELTHPAPVKNVDYQEPVKPKAAPEASDAPTLAPVLIGGKSGGPRAQVKDRFDEKPK
jgi:tetratricopeptide (TPR) repeat protein